ncbi:alpha-2,8-polysialyltransferase family protein [Actinocorallia sp. API 0066]|uniref:alpha-2,8-polysialyltransferase family protein n=1 Tax=Actinocorallia sp. API 0066 TaxID=2896846 RepID=UPI001E31C89C|nr:alpha-2,8-polysialyltransferase family protein [Actinocorallia sp. API 0066]MCD0451167.1 alpha-2,8-polysialyltransferase family protein [Actinocorallia sp. API 0066]
MTTTQILLASTPFGALTLAAALDAGLLGDDGSRRRVLVVSNNAAIPELTPGLTAQPGWETLAHRFHTLVDWNAEIAPLHPSGWTPREDELPLYERWLRDRWGLTGHDIELVVESIAVAPARTLCALFFGAPITVYSDGLMSYGPTRSTLPLGVGSRIDAFLHLDLVPGLVPHLLAEYGVPSRTIPDAAFRKVLDEVTGAVRGALTAPDGTEVPEGTPLMVGQYLAALEILSAQEEDDLHVAMLRGVVARGFTTVLFKPHPASPVRATEHLAAEARRLGVRLLVVDQPVPAEAWCAAVRPALIVGCFSTALVTATRYYGVPAAAVGAEMLLDRLAPYENSNRIPVTIVEATVPALGEDGSLTEPANYGPLLAPLVAAVTYAMQAGTRPELRAEAAAYLKEHWPEVQRFFKRRRLTSLGLPGGLPPNRAVEVAVPRASRRRRMALRAFRQVDRFRD